MTRLFIRREETGEVCEIPPAIVSVSWPEHDYLWVEGNFACSGNRQGFFEDAGGAPDPNDHCCEEPPTYTARIEVDGEIVLDFEDTFYPDAS